MARLCGWETIGKVSDSVENDKLASWFVNDKHEVNRAIVLAIQRQPGTNTVEVVDNIKKLLPQFREQMPAAVKPGRFCTTGRSRSATR